MHGAAAVRGRGAHGHELAGVRRGDHGERVHGGAAHPQLRRELSGFGVDVADQGGR